MDKRTNGHTDGCIYTIQTGGHMDGEDYGRIGIRTDGHTDGRIVGGTDSRTVGWKVARTDGWQADGPTAANGPTNAWRGGRTYGRSPTPHTLRRKSSIIEV